MTSQIKTRKKLKDKNRWIHDLTAGKDISKYNLNVLTRHHNKIGPPKIPDSKPSEPDDNFWDDYVNDLVDRMNKDGKTLPGELTAPTKEKFNWKGAWDIVSTHGVKEFGKVKQRISDQVKNEAKDQLNRSIEIVRRHNAQSNRTTRQPKHYPALEDKGAYKIIDESKHDNIPEDTWSYIAPNKKDVLKIEHGTTPAIEKYNLMPVNSRIRDNTSIDHLERINKPSVEESIKYETAYRPSMPRRPAPRIEIPNINSPFWLGLNDPTDERLLPPERQIMVDDPIDNNNNEVSIFINRFNERMNQPNEDSGNLSDNFDSMYP